MNAISGNAGEPGLKIAAAIPAHAKALLEDLKILQAQIDALPGPRLHQDHDFSGETANLETLYSWLRETAWVPYWGQQPEGAPTLMFLGGRDPWIETLELRLWDILGRLASAAGCELCGRGAVCPDDGELELIHVVYPQVAAAHGWVFSSQGNVVQ